MKRQTKDLHVIVPWDMAMAFKSLFPLQGAAGRALRALVRFTIEEPDRALPIIEEYVRREEDEARRTLAEAAR